MGFGMTFVGLLFFFNPTIRMIDLLPDVIGCFLILAGLAKIEGLDARLEQASKTIRYYLIVSLVKLPLSFFIAFSRPKMLLPLTFLFCVAEVLLLLSFFTRFFGGVQYLLMRYAADERHTKRSESASVVCFIFTIARGAGALLPELLVIGEQSDTFDYTYSPTLAANAAMMKPYAEILCFVIVAVLGVYAAVVTGRFLLGLKKDAGFCRALKGLSSERRTLLMPQADRRRFLFASSLAFAGCFFLFDAMLNFWNVLPNAIAMLFFIAAVVLLDLYEKKRSVVTVLLLLLPIPLSLYNASFEHRLLVGTDIDILNRDMTVARVPEILKQPQTLWQAVLPFAFEYLLVAAALFVFYRRLSGDALLKPDDSTSVFSAFLAIACPACLVSAAYRHIGAFLCTHFSYVTGDIAVFERYDSLVGIARWSFYIAFAVMLYCAFKVRGEMSDRIKG